MTSLKMDDLFKSIDEMNTEKFVSFIAEQGVFIFGNSPEIIGRNNIYDSIDGFFKSIKAIKHYDISNFSKQ